MITLFVDELLIVEFVYSGITTMSHNLVDKL